MGAVFTIPALLWWRMFYWFRKPRTLDEFIRMVRRTRAPWKRFKPSAWHCRHGKQWHIYLANEQYFVEWRTIQVEVHVSMKTGDIVGFDIWDEMLEAKKPKGDDSIPTD